MLHPSLVIAGMDLGFDSGGVQFLKLPEVFSFPPRLKNQPSLSYFVSGFSFVLFLQFLCLVPASQGGCFTLLVNCNV